MSGSKTLSQFSPISGSYYLVEKSKVDQFYRTAGHKDSEEIVPNFIEVDGKECLFTEQFLQKDGKEYELVIVAEGFSWKDIMVYEEEDEFES